jgi:hypothetical protein
VKVFRGLNPERAKDLQDRRVRYERRARSIRYGTVRAGSCKHLLQAGWRAVADLRRPTRLLLTAMAVGSAATAASGLGLPGWAIGIVAAAALPVVLGIVAVGTWIQERRHASRQPGFPPLVSPPERPARRAPQDSPQDL